MKFKDDSRDESKEACPECQSELHHIIKIECTIDCGPNGLTRHDGIFLLDQIVKLVLGRGFDLKSIEFLGKSTWTEIELENVKRLQKTGILQR